jgi:hypothetical protein
MVIRFAHVSFAALNSAARLLKDKHFHKNLFVLIHFAQPQKNSNSSFKRLDYTDKAIALADFLLPELNMARRLR